MPFFSLYKPRHIQHRFYLISLLFILSFLLIAAAAQAQQYLSRQINLTVNQQKLSVVLDSIAQKAGFTFSYNSAQFPGDSLVNFKGQMEVETILDQLLQEKYDYKEIKDYVILRYAPHTFIIYTQPPILTGYGTLLSGQIKDAATGKILENVSVYEKSSLLAVLSNKKGYFQIPLVDDNNAVTLTVSKQYYHDMIMTILPTIKVRTRSRFDSSDNYERRSGSTAAVNRSFLGKMFISTRQKIQSLNISDYFATRPYQFSVIPKWNSRGDMSGQVVSKFSLNLLAGYNGGVHGFEMGSIANLNRTEVEGAQMAGVMNIVGGNSSGFQAAGVANQVYQEGKGLQMAGIYNKVNRSFSGMQAAGIQNKIGGELKGVQVAGLMNSARHLKGTQIAGVINKASTSSGFQLGLINLLDTASGYGIGLVNIARHKGFYQLSVFASESAVANIAFKSGREAFYTKILFGIGQADIDFFYYGIGIGRLFPTTRKTKISLDAAVENYERGAADKVNILYKSSLEFHFPIASGLGFFIGPSVNIHYQKEDPLRPIHIPMKDYPTINRGHDVSGWVGVNAGFDLF